MAKGGARIGAGRKSKAEEDKVRNLAVQSIISKYGSEEKGFMALIETGEPSLMKFVFEHAFGKPKEKIEHSGEMGVNWHETKTYEAKR